MLFDQIAKNRSEGVTLFLFRQDACDIARNRIRSSGADFPVDSGELLLRQGDSNLRLGHTNIIPLFGEPATSDLKGPRRSGASSLTG